MINKTYLFEKLLSYCDNLQGVEEQVLDAHLQKHGLILRADHHSFLLKYGNSNCLLKFGFADSGQARLLIIPTLCLNNTHQILRNISVA